MNIYYVYQYLREDGTPYYIGKGRDHRAYSKDHVVPVPPDKDRIVFVKENLSHEDALSLEKQLIAQYGRKDIGTGILRNMNNGGEGQSGFKHKTTSIEKRTATRRAAGNYCKSPAERAKISSALKGRPKSEEHRRKMSERMTGRVVSEETRHKLKQRASSARSVAQYTADWTLVTIHAQLNFAAAASGLCTKTIYEACRFDKLRGGFYWRYVD